MITAITIWLIGYYFTVGATCKDYDTPFWQYILMLIMWPIVLGTFVQDWRGK